MIKTIQKSAKTEDDAIELALRELGLDRDDVSVEIVERPKSGFLGIGSSPAIVAVTYEAPDEPEIPDSSPAPQTERRHEKRRSSPGSKSANADAGAVCDTHARRSAEGKTNEIREFIAGLLAHFGVAAEIEIGELRGDTIEVALMCAEPGALIGRRGETLEAIQSLTNYAVNKERGARLRVNVDTEN
ncbi:MAG: Jag N-terminal domain-containing protein, partial [Oscillospiraceae bacterium]|nr:Jag N-terminal domain-containing protein [Oscillospiraceae bacterium]